MRKTATRYALFCLVIATCAPLPANARWVSPAPALSDSYTYEGFGTTLSSTGVDANPCRFAGERFVDAAGMYQNRARWLDTRVGRFVSYDKASSRMGYGYAEASPTNWTDPTGHYTVYTPSQGYDAEAAICNEYGIDHNGDFVSYGRWARDQTQADQIPWTAANKPAAIGPIIKPDILNYSQWSWAEIKPFTPSGVARGVASWGLYSGTLTPLGYSPDQWVPEVGWVDTNFGPVFVVNVDGVLFYVTAKAEYEWLLLVAPRGINWVTSNAGREVWASSGPSAVATGGWVGGYQRTIQAAAIATTATVVTLAIVTAASFQWSGVAF